MKRQPRRRGFTLMELLVVIAIILVILTMAIPFYKKQLMLSHETAAIRAIGVIQVAEAQYMAEFGRFATTLPQLGPPSAGTSGPSAAELIPEDLAAGTNSGYFFTVAARPGGYVVQAAPDASPGRFTFYSDETLVIRRSPAPDPATADSPQIR
jgi:prepilin-type N-terminal cleavage/methylation domain-containing protein